MINVEVPSTKSGRVDVYTIFVWLTAEHTHTLSHSHRYSHYPINMAYNFDLLEKSH